uniref:Uncharacterized protein n=1 Tax=Arundo donax TaxID=35708 RepID=A0A0A8ZNA8_ARUDO
MIRKQNHILFSEK